MCACSSNRKDRCDFKQLHKNHTLTLLLLHNTGFFQKHFLFEIVDVMPALAAMKTSKLITLKALQTPNAIKRDYQNPFSAG